MPVLYKQNRCYTQSSLPNIFPLVPGRAAAPDAFAQALSRLLQLWPLLLYGILSVIMTWPLLPELGERIPADLGNDVWAHEWTFWWLKQALLEGRNPYFTQLLFYPNGVELTSHNIAWLNFAAWLPLQALVGSNAAFSLIYPLAFTLNAFAMYLLAREQVHSRPAAVIAGLIFGFWPYTLSQAGHPNMIILFGLPLGLLYLERALDNGQWRTAAAAGFFFALQGIARWQLLVPAAFVAVIFVSARLLMQRALWNWDVVRQLATCGGVMLAVMAPLATPLAVAQLTRPEAQTLLTYEPGMASDLLSYFVPHERLLFWSSAVERLPEWLEFEQPDIVFLGYTVIMLAVIGLLSQRRQAWPWLVMALGLGVAALGATVTIGHHAYAGAPTPYGLVEDWFINQIMRRPDRYNSFLGLPVSMLAALGIAFLHRHMTEARFAVLSLCLGFGIVIEYSQMPYPLRSTEVPKWYQQLAQEPDDFAILGLPISPYFADKYYMHYQIEHGKPMVGGHISRRPPEALAYMEESVFLDDMLEHRIMNASVGDVSHQLRYLADANVRYIVLHKHFSTRQQIEDWKQWLTVAPIHEDNDVVVYLTAPKAEVDFAVGRRINEQLGVIGATVSQREAVQGDLVSFDIGWSAFDTIDQDYAACIALVDSRDITRQTACNPLSADWPTSRWQANEVVRSQFILRVDPHLPADLYRIELTAQNPATTERVGQPAALAMLTVRALPREFTLPQPQHATNLQVGDAIALLGYDLALANTITAADTNTGPDQLQLTLYWQARQPIAQSYKVFVHLVDTASGAILAQSDAPPRQWDYPTDWWEPGEVVVETIELPLLLPLAETELLLGMYDAETGERLPIRGPANTQYPDHAFSLELSSAISP